MSYIIYVDDFDNIKMSLFGGKKHCTAFFRCQRCDKDVISGYESLAYKRKFSKALMPYAVTASQLCMRCIHELID